MNLMNINTHKWEQKLLDACGDQSLRQKLGGEPAIGGTVLGNIGKWWVDRWGFSPDCIIAPMTGDNSSTVVSLSEAGDAILSLGTSTTLLVSIPPSSKSPEKTTTSHLLAHPTMRDGFIVMLCYKNGALAREYVRDHYAEKDWSKFNELVDTTPPGNEGYMGFYFPLYEIIPSNVIGDYFFLNGLPVPAVSDHKHHPRAILESQLLSIRSRVMSILPPGIKLHRLILTGGSSTNDSIRQMASDILNLDAYVAESKEGGSVGGALLALYAWWKKQGNQGDFDELKESLKNDGFKLVAKPDPDRAELYEDMIPLYRKCEAQVVTLNQKNDDQ
jgi:xylulokinase